MRGLSDSRMNIANQTRSKAQGLFRQYDIRNTNDELQIPPRPRRRNFYLCFFLTRLAFDSPRRAIAAPRPSSNNGVKLLPVDIL
jgi:hypothetical protein